MKQPDHDPAVVAELPVGDPAVSPIQQSFESESARAGTPSDDVDDARHAISEFSSLINNADTKAGLATAATAVIVAGIAQQQDALGDALGADTAAERWALVLVALTAIALLVTLVGLGLALIPRTPIGIRGGRFSYPTVAEEEWRFVPGMPRSHVASEAWAQARTLAQIVRRKFTAVKVALIALGVSFVLFCCWTTVAALI